MMDATQKKAFDVIVVGAGPGGSATAINLAEMGWDVLLVDKASFPRDKVCGDFISPRSLRALESLKCWSEIERANPNRIHGASLYLDGRLVSRGTIPKADGLEDCGYTLPRYVLDDIMFRVAQNRGATTLEDCEVTDLDNNTYHAVVCAKLKGNPITLESRLVIAADGAYSVIARCLGMENHNAKNRIIALRAYFQGVEGDATQANLFFDSALFPGYAWIFPLGNDRANVGLGVVQDIYKRHNINLYRQMKHWIETDPYAQVRLGRSIQDGRIVGWPLTMFTPDSKRYAERVLFIGDAGSFVDPINGEGIHTALETARIAASVADEALRSGDCSAEFLSLYERRWRSVLDLDLRTSDLFVTVISNRSLSGLWLLILKMIGEKALRDDDYATICGGILAGVVPTYSSLTPEIVLKTLMQSPGFWLEALGFSPKNGITGLVSSGLEIAGEFLDVMREVAHHPKQTAEWGWDVASKELEVLTGLLHNLQRERDQKN